MLIPAIWQKLLTYRTKPFRFVAGIRNSVQAGDYCPFHDHAALEIVYHPSGRGITTLAGKSVVFEELSAVIYAPGEAHDQAAEASGEDLCVQLAIPAAASFKTGLYVPHVSEPWIGEEIHRLCRPESECDEVSLHVLNLRATAVLMGLLNSLRQHSNREESPLPLRRAILAERYIARHFATIQSVAEVAKHVGISHDHLRHLYRQVRGKSLVRCLNEARIERAKLLLANSPFPLKQIASLCGFKDEYYFSAVFRKVAGLAPGAFRKS